jgi:uncharacterized protein DUF1490
MSGALVGCLSRRLVDYAVAGVVGTSIVRGAPKLRPTLRRAAVGAVAGGIMLSRRLETLTEEARLAAGDVYAEARKRLGEEVTEPPAASHRNGHEH